MSDSQLFCEECNWGSWFIDIEYINGDCYYIFTCTQCGHKETKEHFENN